MLSGWEVSEHLLKCLCSSCAAFHPRELREKLKPELLELIRQQRLLHLCEGTLFRKISSRRRQGACQDPAPGWGACQGGRGLFPCPLPPGKSQLIFGSRMLNSLDSWYGLNHGLGEMGSADKGAAPSPLGRASLVGETENFLWLFCCRQAVVLPPVPQPQGAALWGCGGGGAVSPHREPDREK